MYTDLDLSFFLLLFFHFGQVIWEYKQEKNYIINKRFNLKIDLTKHYYKIQEESRTWEFKKTHLEKKICVQGNKRQIVVIAFIGSEV